MQKSKEEIAEDVEQTRADAKYALENAREVWSGRNAAAATWRSTKGAYFRAQDKIVDTAEAADETIRSNIYSSIGIALGAGALLGFFLARKSKRRAKNAKR